MAIRKLITVTEIRPSTLVNLGQREKGGYDVQFCFEQRRKE